METKTITVTGRGAIHVVPDITRLTLTLDTIHDTYERAYAEAKDDTEHIGRIMELLGLSKSLPKTTRMDIDKKTANQYDKYNNYTGEKFIGFRLIHEVKIDLGMDNVLLNKIVQAFGKYLSQAEINIGYTVRDARPAQLKMLDRAVRDAKEKAGIMANACGCTLGDVQTINYSFQELHVYSQARQIHNCAEACCCNEESLDITPDDLEVSDDVTVVWELLNNK